MDRVWRLQVEVAGHAYPVLVGPKLLSRLPTWVPREASSYFLVADSRVFGLYGESVLETLGTMGRVAHAVFPEGEASKSRQTKAAVEDAMFRAGLDRRSVVVALGGGVTTDLAGFAAATYMRGIRYVSLPTSLLAMVDASVGGKTGVNTPWGKNTVGAFHQPRAVLADVAVLETLPRRCFADGLAEMLKHGFCLSAAHYRRLVEAGPEVVDRPEVLAGLVAESVELKARVVARDPKEANLRSVLNFGHTVGHAIERVTDWSESHGRAVAAGMWAEALVAERLGLLPAEDRRALEEGLDRFGLLWFPAVSLEGLLEAMGLDKKNEAGRLRMALPRTVGRMAKQRGRWTVDVPPDVVRSVVEELSRRAATEGASPQGRPRI